MPTNAILIVSFKGKCTKTRTLSQQPISYLIKDHVEVNAVLVATALDQRVNGVMALITECGRG